MSEPRFEAVIHPYRSLGPLGFKILLGVVIAANAVGAAVMLSVGAWPVAGFMGLDVLAVYVAFRLSYGQMRAFERITINGEALIVERVDVKGRRRAWQFPSYWVNVVFDGDEEFEATVTVRSHGRSLEIGEYLSPFERKAFADALKLALHDAKALPAAT
ncbi:MAG: DUF2244 domain-containing protein [Alphaproteobacteria bacterium]|nr:DUF2244 domain-containing protein [Alphaproteobacteria bacterium]